MLDTVGGKTPYKATTLESSIASTVVASMQRNGVRRLMLTSISGEGDSRANTSISNRLLLATFLRGADKAGMEATIRSNGLDSIILRPAILGDGPVKGGVRVFDPETGEKAHKITRSDLDAFMVAQLSSDEHLHQTVTIAND